MRTHMGQELNDLGIREISGWDEISAQRLDVALIANPTNMHIDTAIRCAERGLHLFIEKPIDCRLDSLDHLLRIVAERRLTAYVAYPMRFHPVVRSGRVDWLGAGSCTPTWSVPRSCQVGDPIRITSRVIPPTGLGAVECFLTCHTRSTWLSTCSGL